ncbi:hypothetical protein CCP4SC76_2660008 [Gammaproteobacteria bacterium]
MLFLCSMDISSYLKANAKKLAESSGTRPVYLRQIASGFRKPSAALAWRLECASGGVISRYDLRPDIFGSREGGHIP